MNINWDGEKYTSDFSFVHQYGNSALSKALRDEGYQVIRIDRRIC